MSKERELLGRVLEGDHGGDFFITNRLLKEIRDYLAQPEHIPDVGNMVTQEPVAWMYDWNIIEEEEYGETRYDCLTRADSITKSRAITNVMPLYASPPKR